VGQIRLSGQGFGIELDYSSPLNDYETVTITTGALAFGGMYVEGLESRIESQNMSFPILIGITLNPGKWFGSGPFARFQVGAIHRSRSVTGSSKTTIDGMSLERDYGGSSATDAMVRIAFGVDMKKLKFAIEYNGNKLLEMDVFQINVRILDRCDNFAIRCELVKILTGPF